MIMNIRQRLNKNYNELNGLYHDISMKLGLSDSESMVMYMLYDIQEPLTQSDIVKATGLSKQTLNSAIRKLEKEGIIILEKLNEKSKKIVMTDKGQVLIEQKMKPLVDMEDRVLASWTEEDRRKYLELIEKFKVQFEKEVKEYDKMKYYPVISPFHIQKDVSICSRSNLHHALYIHLRYCRWFFCFKLCGEYSICIPQSGLSLIHI